MIRFPEELIKEYSVQPRLGTFENALEIAHFFEKQFEGFYELKSLEKNSATFVMYDDGESCYNDKFKLKIYFREQRDGYRSEIQFGLIPNFYHYADEANEFIEMCKKLFMLEDINLYINVYYGLRKNFPEITRQFLKEMFE